MHAALLLASAVEGGAEASKTPFYVAGGLLAIFAVVVAGLGIVKDDFPSSRGATLGVMALASVFVVATMVTSVLTG